jgi:hypothetical protein
VRLFAEVSDEELLGKLMHELGSTFYRQTEQGVYEIVYFSANRIVRYHGKLTEKMAELIKASGYKVARIEIDEISQTVKISQVTS